MNSEPKIERNNLVLKLYLTDKWCQQKIADKLGISRQRVQQILKCFPEYLLRKKRNTSIREELLPPKIKIKCQVCGKIKEFRQCYSKKKFCDRKCFKEHFRLEQLKFIKKGKRKCKMCKKIKILAGFTKKKNQFGWMSYCKKCAVILSNQWRSNHPIRYKEYQKEWHKQNFRDNREKFNEQFKLKYKNDKEFRERKKKNSLKDYYKRKLRLVV